MTEIIPALDKIVVQGVRNEVIKYEGRPAIVIYGTESMSSAFEYESDKPFTNGKLILEALDHDKPDGKTAIEISVNGKMIFSGANSASKENYTTLTFPVPDALVKKGRNSLGIRNLSPAAPMANWFIVSEIKITPSNSSCKTVLNNPELKIWKEKGVKAEITSIPGRFNLQMLTPGEKDYSLRAYYPLEKADPDKNYRVRFSISCSDNQTAFLAHIIRVNDWGSLGSITVPSVSDGKRFELNFKTNKEDKSPHIWFSIGKLSPGAQLTISNIIVDEQQ